MSIQNLKPIIEKIFESISNQIPDFQNSPADWSISEGNVSVCIIDELGNIYGKIWGNNKLKGRKYFDIAYRKASQVWITGYNTGEYEKLVFSGEINHKEYGIELPDLMGWDGGQMILLNNEMKIACGFSGFKGVNDLAIVKKAAKDAIK